MTAALLAASTGGAGLLVRDQSTPAPASSHPSYLTAAPAVLSLTCTGKSATGTLTLRDSGSTALTWSAQPPAGLTLSATLGILKQGASTTVTVAAHATRPSRGTLTFTSSLGSATVTYTVTCG